jgi:hypothetical protein
MLLWAPSSISYLLMSLSNRFWTPGKMRADNTGLVMQKPSYVSAESSVLKLSWCVLVEGGWSFRSKHLSLIILSFCVRTIDGSFGRFIRLHYSHLFRVDTLITPPKAPLQPSQERWISSTTLLEEGERAAAGSNNGKLSPLNVLRTPMIPATPDHASGNRRSPTPLFLRENSPGASSPLTPLHFIRRAGVEPGGGLAPSTPSIREKSPGLSSDGGGSMTGSASGKRPRLSAPATPGARRTQQLQTQGTPGGRRPWR